MKIHSMEKMINGKLFCITGGLENFPLKKDAYEEIMHHGGNTTNKVSSACDFLILGAKGNPNYAQGEKGNKQLKVENWAAKGYSIKIISENQFVSLLEDSEELNEENWGTDLSGQKTNTPCIDNSTKNGLEISSAFWPPKPNLRQVLRIGFKTHEADESIIGKWRDPQKKIKSILTEADLKHSIRTELIPASWSGNEQKKPSSENLVLSCRIIALLDSTERKDRAKDIATAITALLIENNCEGMLSLRIWDETYRYGKYWIKKLT